METAAEYENNANSRRGCSSFCSFLGRRASQVVDWGTEGVMEPV